MVPIDRRAFLAGSAVTLAGPKLAAAALPDGPPAARIAPVTDTYFGETRTDPYRWMENPHDPDWLPFLRGQNAYTRRVLDRIPGWAGLLARIGQYTADAAVTRAVQAAPARLFFQQRPAGANNFRLFVREAGATRTLVDPEALSTPGSHVSLDWWTIAPDGTHVVYGLSVAGSEDSVARIMDVASGHDLPERIPNTQNAEPSWLPDGSGFFYTQLTSPRGSPDRYLNSQSRLHRLGTDPAHDPIVLKNGLDRAVPIDPRQIPIVMATAGSATALAMLPDIRREFPIYAAPLADVVAGRAAWQRVCAAEDLVRGFALAGDVLHLLTTKGAERGRIVRTSAGKPDFAAAATVVAEGELVLSELNQAADGVYVTTMDGGLMALQRLAPGGGVQTIALPFDGGIDSVFTAPALPGAYAIAQGWLAPNTVLHVEAGARTAADTGLTPKPAIDLSPYVSRRVFATARDGTRVPIDLVHRRDLKADGSAPTLVTAYGSYEIALTPRFQPQLLALLDAGGVYGTAHVRGGGEYGPAWHRAGQLDNKPNTWHDLIDCCQHLIDERVTAPAHLGIYGRSAGGITMGQALNERPDLFAAVISGVGWHNPLRYVAEENGAGEENEWGAITDRDGYRTLKLIDSYQAVRDGTKFPAVLLTTGVTDPRVAVWHVTKMTARLQHATASGKPVLLRVDFDAGHGIGSTRAQADAEMADILAFLLWQTKAAGFQPA